MTPLEESPDRSDVVDRSFVQGATTVGTSAIEAKVGGSRVTSRQIVFIYNDSNKTMFWGPSTVTSSGSTKGIPLLPGDFVSLPFGDLALYVIGEQAGQAVIFGEIS